MKRNGFSPSRRSAENGFSPSRRSAENGFSPSRRSAENGFTLLEMLIALSIFGMLTAAGVTLLGVTARTQETSDRLLEEVGEVRRAGALLTADLAHAVPRLYRGSDGGAQRAFAGTGGDAPELLAFVRRGWNAGEGAGLQRVGYRLRGNTLERLAFAEVDGSAEAVAVGLVDDVRRVRLRYRDSDGAWRERWDPTDASELPNAVELITETGTHGLVRQLFLVGSPRR